MQQYNLFSILLCLTVVAGASSAQMTTTILEMKIPDSNLSGSARLEISTGSQIAVGTITPEEFLTLPDVSLRRGSVKLAEFSYDRNARHVILGAAICRENDECVRTGSIDDASSFLPVDLHDLVGINNTSIRLRSSAPTSGDDAFELSYPWRGTAGVFSLNNQNFRAYLAALRIQHNLGFIRNQEQVDRVLGDLAANRAFLYHNDDARRLVISFLTSLDAEPSSKISPLQVLEKIIGEAEAEWQAEETTSPHLEELIDAFAHGLTKVDLRESNFPMRRVADLLVKVERSSLCMRLMTYWFDYMATSELDALGPQGTRNVAAIADLVPVCLKQRHRREIPNDPSLVNGEVSSITNYASSRYRIFFESYTNHLWILTNKGVIFGQNAEAYFPIMVAQMGMAE